MAVTSAPSSSSRSDRRISGWCPERIVSTDALTGLSTATAFVRQKHNERLPHIALTDDVTAQAS